MGGGNDVFFYDFIKKITSYTDALCVQSIPDPLNYCYNLIYMYDNSIKLLTTVYFSSKMLSFERLQAGIQNIFLALASGDFCLFLFLSYR